MSSLDLPVEVKLAPTGLASALVNELCDHLQRLVDTGDAQTIDLSGLPLNDADKEQLDDILGRGEVEVTLNSMGESKIHETAYHGVWWIRHYSVDGKLVSEFIEVTWIPDILKAHPDDVKASAAALKSFQANQQRSETHES